MATLYEKISSFFGDNSNHDIAEWNEPTISDEPAVALKTVQTSDGESVNEADLREPQTARMHALHHEFQGHPARGLTPTKLAAIMIAAEQGDITAQAELFEDMEERDAHIMSEMGKRRRSITGLEWNIVPPDKPTAAEKKATDELLYLVDSFDEFENVLFDTTDAIGKGFVCQEIEWHRQGGFWLPKNIEHRPQSWFQINRGFTQEIALRGAGQGEALQPFGWMVHKHKAKSGYLERSALFRVLAWPYLFKNYSVGDLAEFLEIYGIPLRLGTYPSGATEKEKVTLLRALAQIGHNAAGIIPQGMEIKFENAADGDPEAFRLMMDWCDKAQSKAILGGTLTSQADGASSTNALGNVHNEVRKELVVSDAKQISTTISRDLIYPIAVLNGLVKDWNRCPRYVLDTSETEDMMEMARALPSLVNLGFKIKRQWAQERVGIPEPEEGEEILQRRAPPVTKPDQGPNQPDDPNKPEPPETEAARTALKTCCVHAALRAETDAAPSPPQQMVDQARNNGAVATTAWINQIRELVNRVNSLEQLREELLLLYPTLTLDQYASAMAEALAASHLAGRNEVTEEEPRALS